MIRHIVMFTFREDTPDQIRAEALRTMEGFLRTQQYGASSWMGQDAGLASGNASLAIVVDFPSAQAFSAFQECDEHLETLRSIRPYVTARSAIQSTTAVDVSAPWRRSVIGKWRPGRDDNLLQRQQRHSITASKP